MSIENKNRKKNRYKSEVIWSVSRGGAWRQPGGIFRCSEELFRATAISEIKQKKLFSVWLFSLLFPLIFFFFLSFLKKMPPTTQDPGPRTSNTNTEQIRIYLMIYVVAQINLSWFLEEIIKIIEVKPWLNGLPTWPKSPTRLVLTTILRQERRMTKALKAIDIFHNMKKWKK